MNRVGEAQSVAELSSNGIGFREMHENILASFGDAWDLTGTFANERTCAVDHFVSLEKSQRERFGESKGMVEATPSSLPR